MLAFTLAFLFSPAARRYVRSTSAAPEGVPRAGSAPESSNLFHKGLSERNRTTWQIWTPPFNPSQEVRTYRRAASKICRARPWIGFFRDFLLSKKRSKFYIEKTSKKLRKSSILVSQNPPKSLPKSFQNRCPEKHSIFHRFWLVFFVLLILRFLENVDFS